MGDILRDNYMLDDESGLTFDLSEAFIDLDEVIEKENPDIKLYIWEVYFDKKLLATFERCVPMFDYYFKMKKSLSEAEKPLLHWNLKEL